MFSRKPSSCGAGAARQHKVDDERSCCSPPPLARYTNTPLRCLDKIDHNPNRMQPPASRAAALQPPPCCALRACPEPARPAWGLRRGETTPGAHHQLMYLIDITDRQPRHFRTHDKHTYTSRAHRARPPAASESSQSGRSGVIETTGSPNCTQKTCQPLTVLVHQSPQDLHKVVVLLHVCHGAQVLERLEAVVVRIVLHLWG